MSKAEIIFKNAKYTDDAVSRIFSDLHEKLRKREEMSIWGPINLPKNFKSSCLNEQEKVHDDAHMKDVSSIKMQKMIDSRDVFTGTSSKEKENYAISSISNCLRDGLQSNTAKKKVKISEVIDQIPQELLRNNKKNISESEIVKIEKSYTNEACKSEIIEDGNDTFQDWRSERNEEFEKTKFSDIIKQKSSDSLSSRKMIVGRQTQPTNESPTCIEVSQETSRKKLSSSTKGYLKVKSNINQADTDLKNNACDIKQIIYSSTEYLQRGAKKTEEKFSSLVLKERPHLCIKITDIKSGKSYELMSNLADILRTKTCFIELAEIIPAVDSESNEINFSAEAVNIIFRYIFSRIYNFDIKMSPLLGIEILAATHSWKMYKFHKMFLKDFLQKALTPSNVNSIFSYANDFDLKEICDECKRFSQDNINLKSLSYERNQKTCSITISTYVEPLEFCMPFNPIRKCFRMSFDRHIENKITFKALSGCYIITGFQIQLNENHLQENSYESKRLEIYYSIKSLSDNQEINNREEKPLRGINIIYFNKNLVVNPQETAEIIVEAETMPYLCSALTEQEARIKTSEFTLSMSSNFKAEGSDTKVFIIGKLFYNVKKSSMSVN